MSKTPARPPLVTLIRGDCLDVLRTLPDNSVDSIVTDPPYGLSFMGKKWDYDVPSVEVWAECLRVLKPGGHLLAFAGTRTQHRMAVRIEDAGFEIRDMIAWVYGSGFPKSLDVSKAIDKAAGAEREIIGRRTDGRYAYGFSDEAKKALGGVVAADSSTGFSGEMGLISAPATDAARQWEGWGTALKPALEPITVARKPLVGTVAANVMEHGTGAINVDGCRIEATDKNPAPVGQYRGSEIGPTGLRGERDGSADALGRWPANLIHDGSDEVLSAFPQAPGQLAKASTSDTQRAGQNTYGAMSRGSTGQEPRIELDKSAARFFYCAKASSADRNLGLGEVGPQFTQGSTLRDAEILNASGDRKGNFHPTVKPTALMRYLVRLVTPPGGTVLDCFGGSGSTGVAAILEGFDSIVIERDEDENGQPLGYMDLIRARTSAALRMVEEAANDAAIESAQQDLFGDAA